MKKTIFAVGMLFAMTMSATIHAQDSEKKDNEEWTAKYGKPLWEIDESGYMIVDSIWLSRENWKDKEARNEYLEEYCYQLEDFIASELAGM